MRRVLPDSPSAALALTVALLAGCHEHAADDSGTRRAQRVVSLLPAATQIILDLGAVHRLVGRVESDTMAAARHLPSVGNLILPNIEVLLTLQPDLVVAWDDAQVLQRLRPVTASGASIMALRVETLHDLRSVGQQLGKALGLQSVVDSLLRDLDESLVALARLQTTPSLQVAVLVGTQPPVAAGPGTYSDELLQLVGATNAFAGVESQWPQTSTEAIAALDPDLVLFAVAGLSKADLHALMGSSPWRAVPAARHGRTRVVDPGPMTIPSLAAPTVLGELAALLTEVAAEHGQRLRAR